MYKNKKTGIVGIVITIIILIIIVVLSNTDLNKISHIENIFSSIVMPIQNGLTYLKNKVDGNDSFFTDVKNLQAENDELREEGTNKVLEYSEEIEVLKRDKIYTKSEKEARISELNGKLQKAKEIEAKNKQPINDKIAVAEKYLKDHYQTDYYNKVVESNKYEVQKAKADYDKKLKELEKEHKDILSGLSDKEEIKEENFIYKNRLFDAKLEYTKNMQEAKDRKHDAFTFEYHLIDLLKMSNFSFAEKQAQKIENYKYSFNTRDFLLKNGLYIAIILVFIFLCIITPIKKNGLQLFTVNNILSIMQQASPRMFLA